MEECHECEVEWENATNSYVSFEWKLGIDRTCRVSKYIIDKVQ